jgi:HPt (histidine-containing phosphotransfer) domain-containing protein
LYEKEENIIELLKGEFSYSLKYFTEIAPGDKGFIKKMLTVFEVQTPLNVEMLAKAIAQNDFETAAHIAHKMKPTFMMFGVNNINIALAAIEKDALLNNNMPNIAKIFEEMLPVINKVYKKWQEGKI